MAHFISLQLPLGLQGSSVQAQVKLRAEICLRFSRPISLHISGFEVTNRRRSESAFMAPTETIYPFKPPFTKSCLAPTLDESDRTVVPFTLIESTTVFV